jgi:hypothetical protein
MGVLRLEGQHHCHGCRRTAELCQGWDVTDHVGVTLPLAGRCSKGRPEVKLEVVEAGSDKVVESDATLTNQVMHQVASPADTSIPSCLVGAKQLNIRKSQAKPCLEHVITCAGNRDRPFLAESGGTGGAGEHHRNLCEPPP